MRIDDQIIKAAELIKNGEVAAFPTETVYGLGANALDGKAVKKIFSLKNRPADNPLIVHISNLSDLEKIAENPSAKIQKLIKHFWPGGLSVVFQKKSIVPAETTGGLDTVVVRMPSNTITRRIIEEAGVPIAAPSANISGKPSPTHHDHVKKYFGEKVFVVEGESCELGLESTVIAEKDNKIHLLRPGAITVEEIESVLKEKVIVESKDPQKPVSPGQMYKHYSP